MNINCSTNCTAPCTPWFIVLNYIVLKRNIRQVQKFVASVHTFSSQLPPLFIGSLCPPWPAASDWKWLNHGDTIVLAGSVPAAWVYHRLSRVCPSRNPSINLLLLASPVWQRKRGSVYMIAFPSENLSALDWTSDQWPVQYVRGRDVILFLNSFETIETLLWLYHQTPPVKTSSQASKLR